MFSESGILFFIRNEPFLSPSVCSDPRELAGLCSAWAIRLCSLGPAAGPSATEGHKHPGLCPRQGWGPLRPRCCIWGTHFTSHIEDTTPAGGQGGARWKGHFTAQQEQQPRHHGDPGNGSVPCQGTLRYPWGFARPKVPQPQVTRSTQ